ncbi:transporter substrate-binding domain-containing protein, partial [Streptococcus agalactiae]|nr:transporter substrate-binding domain-containing protein [Streptococcus agalactiae]
LSLFTALLITFGGMTSIQADEYLRVGMEAAYAPFNWTQNDNTNGAVPIEGTDQYANGYDVQVAKKLAKKLNKKVVVVKTKWEGLVPALTSGKLDMIIAGMSPTEERKKEINFSKPYYISEPTLVVNAEGKYTNAKNISDFKNAK